MPLKIQSQEWIKEKYFPQQHEPVVGNPQGWTWDHNGQHSAPYSGRSMEGQGNMYQENMNQIQQDQFKHYYEHFFQGRQGTSLFSTQFSKTEVHIELKDVLEFYCYHTS